MFIDEPSNMLHGAGCQLCVYTIKAIASVTAAMQPWNNLLGSRWVNHRICSLKC